eukprot:TRINITY_DN2567_c1_g1_i1.p1 TRINITY_DN2567_c1_g1~~TRINITY_DN2567_c1_g1_i1.p1  ORF type:complete len:521 (-),score=96.41 TRINITY_DN2567_c1_g1_i1:1146-2708(-)
MFALSLGVLDDAAALDVCQGKEIVADAFQLCTLLGEMYLRHRKVGVPRRRKVLLIDEIDVALGMPTLGLELLLFIRYLKSSAVGHYFVQSVVAAGTFSTILALEQPEYSPSQSDSARAVDHTAASTVLQALQLGTGHQRTEQAANLVFVSPFSASDCFGDDLLFFDETRIGHQLALAAACKRWVVTDGTVNEIFLITGGHAGSVAVVIRWLQDVMEPATRLSKERVRSSLLKSFDGAPITTVVKQYHSLHRQYEVLLTDRYRPILEKLVLQSSLQRFGAGDMDEDMRLFVPVALREGFLRRQYDAGAEVFVLTNELVLNTVRSHLRFDSLWDGQLQSVPLQGANIDLPALVVACTELMPPRVLQQASTFGSRNPARATSMKADRVPAEAAYTSLMQALLQPHGVTLVQVHSARQYADILFCFQQGRYVIELCAHTAMAGPESSVQAHDDRVCLHYMTDLHLTAAICVAYFTGVPTVPLYKPEHLHPSVSLVYVCHGSDYQLFSVFSSQNDYQHQQQFRET